MRTPASIAGHPIHPMLVPIPIGLWIFSLVCDLIHAAGSANPAWSTVALARMGHQTEARAALLAYFNAQPTGKMRAQVNGANYQISVVRYWGDGAEEPFFTQEGATNIEFDDWGEALSRFQ